MYKKQAKKELLRLSGVLLFIIIVLGGFILYLSVPLLEGREVVLSTQPVDPFDLIRGQHIIIRYEINTIPLIENAQIGDNVYVILEEDETGIWRYDSASLSKPNKDLVFIKGNIDGVSSETMNVKYGIEQYFFERNAKLETRGMTVKAKISKNGGARIVELLQDGQPIQIEPPNKSLTS